MPLRPGFRGKIFLAIFGVAAVSLLTVATLVSLSLPRQTYARIEQGLISEARLVADVLARHDRQAGREAIEAEAARLAATLPARVTFVGPDGTVVADSTAGPQGLATMENHGQRPEVLEARTKGAGASRRYSATLRTDMLYVAVPVQHPEVAVVRLALPLTEVAQQISSVRRVTLLALGLALTAALGLAWLSSVLLAGRLNALAAAARRYAAGDLSEPVRDYGRDELGTVARSLDEVVRELAGRVSELARDRARTEAILASMVEGVVVVNAQGQVQAANDAARGMLGVAEGTTGGGHYLEWVRHPGVAALVTAALRGERTAGLEMAPARSGAPRLVARASPITAPAAGAVLVLHDISDLRRADQVRRDFVANVSHELRTPLTAIRGYVEALADEPADGEARSRFLQVITRHVNRMERLVRDLLRLASLDARQEVVDWGSCRLAALCSGVASDLAPLIDSRRQRVEVDVDPAVETIRTDAAKLQDVLRNLLENALNYSPEGTAVRMAAVERGGRVLVTVADEGPGIPDADLERIFERFYRVDKARSRESGGTGLGLSIVKHLVALLGGQVFAANRQGGGAVFTVSLPLSRP